MGTQKGVDITREAWQVIRTDRELLIFPVLSGLAAAAIVATIVAAGLLIPGFTQWGLDLAQAMGNNQPQAMQARITGAACLLALYFVEWFIVIFFNTALVGCALIRYSGGNPTVADGFGIASKRLPQILAWTLVTSIVGWALSMIEQQLDWIGRVIIRLIGVTWAVATYFVVPVLAAEGTGPIQALRRSVGLLTQTWGTGLTGNFVIGLLSSGVGILALLFATCGFLLAVFMESIVIAAVTAALLIIGLVLIAVVTSAMHQVFLAGLYRYATTGETPQGFSEATLRQALKQV